MKRVGNFGLKKRETTLLNEKFFLNITYARKITTANFWWKKLKVTKKVLFKYIYLKLLQFHGCEQGTGEPTRATPTSEIYIDNVVQLCYQTTLQLAVIKTFTTDHFATSVVLDGIIISPFVLDNFWKNHRTSETVKNVFNYINSEFGSKGNLYVLDKTSKQLLEPSPRRWRRQSMPSLWRHHPNNNVCGRWLKNENNEAITRRKLLPYNSNNYQNYSTS